MARRTTYNDPLTGRFISAAEAATADAVRRVYEDGNLVSEDVLIGGRVVDPFGERLEPNWATDGSNDTERAYQWHAGGAPLNVRDADDVRPPDDATGFRIIFQMPQGGRYEGGFASSGWAPMDDWNPSAFDDLMPGNNGIERIVFARPR